MRFLDQAAHSRAWPARPFGLPRTVCVADRWNPPVTVIPLLAPSRCVCSPPSTQTSYARIKEIKTHISLGKALQFSKDEQGTIQFRKRICVSENDHLRQLTLKKAHDSVYSIHLGNTKLYQDLKQKYQWYGLKRNVVTHIALGDGCQRVKAEHQRPTSLLQPLKVLE